LFLKDEWYISRARGNLMKTSLPVKEQCDIFKRRKTRTSVIFSKGNYILKQAHPNKINQK
jgi:hypothetical protein